MMMLKTPTRQDNEYIDRIIIKTRGDKLMMRLWTPANRRPTITKTE